MLFQKLNIGSRYASSPEISSILCLAAALLIAWLRPAPTEGAAAILTELFCWLWVFVWFEVLPWTGVPWSSSRTAAASNSKVRLVAAALGISFTALGASLDDCRWIEVSSVATCMPYSLTKTPPRPSRLSYRLSHSPVGGRGA